MSRIDWPSTRVADPVGPPADLPLGPDVLPLLPPAEHRVERPAAGPRAAPGRPGRSGGRRRGSPRSRPAPPGSRRPSPPTGRRSRHPDRPQLRELGRQPIEDLGRLVGRAVVDDHDLEAASSRCPSPVGSPDQRPEGPGDLGQQPRQRLGLVPRRDDDRQADRAGPRCRRSARREVGGRCIAAPGRCDGSGLIGDMSGSLPGRLRPAPIGRRRGAPRPGWSARYGTDRPGRPVQTAARLDGRSATTRSSPQPHGNRDGRGSIGRLSAAGRCCRSPGLAPIMQNRPDIPR